MTHTPCPPIHGVRFASFLAITDWMQLNHDERIALLGGVDGRIYRDWCARVAFHEPIALDAMALARCEALQGVYGALRAVFPVDEQARIWLKGAHHGEGFAGRSPLARMSEPDKAGVGWAIYVRRYLEAYAAGNGYGF